MLASTQKTILTNSEKNAHKLNSQRTNKDTQNKPMLKTQIHTFKSINCSLAALIYITSCQSTDSQRHAKIVKVLEAQNTVAQAALDERDSQSVREALTKNGDLVRAEAHLRAVLVGLMRSNEAIKEAIENESVNH
mgnify:CR=1 FL=1